MKKRYLYIIIFSVCILLLCGCDTDKELGSKTITTTVYPIEYLVRRMYPDNSDIVSIYPNGTNIADYSLTDKQVKDYAKSTSLFVYNGLSNEKEIAKTLINRNKKMQIADVSYGLKYSYGTEELWLNPNNYLMLANTIKDDLIELSSSKYAAEKIDANYQDLEEDLSLLDAELRNIANATKETKNNTIVIAYDAFAFLQEYGFDVVNISQETNITTSIKNKFKNKEYKSIFVKDIKSIPDEVKDLVDNYNATLIELPTMTTLTDDERNNNETYLTLMRVFISNLSNTVLQTKS